MTSSPLQPKKVLLIFPRFRYPSGDLPTGLATLAAYLRETIANLDLELLDTSFCPSFSVVAASLARFKPDITGIFIDVVMAEDALRTARIAKQNGSTVIAGGPQATMLAEEIIVDDSIDAVCLGEGEHTLREYIESFYDDKNFENVRGLWLKTGRGIWKTAERDFIENLDSLPSPAFDLFDMERYINNFFQLDSFDPHLRGISMTVSRGCPYQCRFCQPTVHKILGRKVRIRSPERVIADIQLLQRKYRLNAFYFSDDLITVVPGWLQQFCARLKEKRLQLFWACNTRADTLDYQTMQLMQSTGLVKIKVGIEAISDRIRNGVYNKKIEKSDITELLDNARRLRIQVAGFFMLGAPTETAREVWDTVTFAAGSSLCEALFSVTTPFPGSWLYDDLLEKGWQPPSKTKRLSYHQVCRPRMSPSEISPARLAVYKKLGNFYFYLHPRRILTTLNYFKNIKALQKLLLKLKRI